MSDKAELRVLLLKARIYRLASIVFVLMGIVVFAIMFFKAMGGDFLSAMRDPYFIFIVAFPFLPAAVLSWIASRLEKKLVKQVESGRK